MSKLIFTTLMSLLAGLTVFAQAPDSVLARVRYTYINKLDTLQYKTGHTENMLLFIGKNASLYTSYDILNHEISSEQTFRANMAMKAGSGKPTAFLVDKTPTKYMSRTDFLFFNKENKMFTKQIIDLFRYLVEENIPETTWTINKDTASFSGVKCQQATAVYDGKKWTAWFAPSLPFQVGPWKLYGLPGLIVEAYDENKDIQFKFAGIEQAKLGDHVRLFDITKRPGATPDLFNALDQMIGLDVGSAYFENIIKLPKNAIKTNKAQVEKLKKAYEEDPRGFVRSQYAH